MARFFIEFPLKTGTSIALPRAQANHAVRALRIRSGEEVTLFDGSGGQYRARLAYSDEEAVTAEILDFEATETELPVAITVAQGLAGGDKMDWIIEKSVELGAAAIQPLATQRSVVRLEGERAERRLEHWRNLTRAAAEQCGRNRVPEVFKLTSLARWIDSLPDTGLRLILAPGAGTPLSQLQRPAEATAALLIGPEGGLSPAEVELAMKNGFAAVSIGPRVLRTETAALAALAIIGAAWST